MTDLAENICIETDEFLFEAPAAYKIEALDEYAELGGPNGETLVISSYSIGDQGTEQERRELIKDITKSMQDAVDDPDLITIRPLSKTVTDDGLSVWSVLTEADDESHFFDQYMISNDAVSVVISIEGDYQNKASSLMIEEAVYAIEFK